MYFIWKHLPSWISARAGASASSRKDFTWGAVILKPGGGLKNPQKREFWRFAMIALADFWE